MIDYGTIRNRVAQFIDTRDGLRNPKDIKNKDIFIGELTGIFCEAAYSNNLTTSDVVGFLSDVEDHSITGLVDDGTVCEVASLIDDNITSNPLYNITERTLMKYIPGSVQVGPGEFFMCFYDRYSTFGIDNLCGYDVIVDGVTTEMKNHGSNFTTPEMFDKYAASPKVERLLVVKPVSNAKNPQKRSQYACVSFDKMDWREAFGHKTPQGGGLSFVSRGQ